MVAKKVKKTVHKDGSPTKTPRAKQKGAGDDYGFGNMFAQPNKKLAGPVGVTAKKGIKIDKKGGRPDRPLKGPVGAVFPFPKTKGPRKAKAK